MQWIDLIELIMSTHTQFNTIVHMHRIIAQMHKIPIKLTSRMVRVCKVLIIQTMDFSKSCKGTRISGISFA